MFEIVQKPIEPDVLRNKLKDPAAGALVVFEGMVRNNHQGQDVLRLEYQAFGPMAVKEGEKILMEATDNFGLLGAFCQHRVGVLEIGEVAVWIGVITGHRQEGFEACRFIIDEIKKSVPIWKKEYFTHGSSHWVKSE